MTMQPNNKCTCPSGDGSLRWPCPVHPAASAHEAVGEVYQGSARRPQAKLNAELPVGTKLYAAPVTAAPVEPKSPSYDGLLLMMQSVCGALSRAGLTDCDDPGEAIDVIRERLEKRVAELERQLLASTSAAPGIDLSEVPRYTLAHGDFTSEMLEHSQGAWVRLGDVESVLIDASPKGAAPRFELTNGQIAQLFNFGGTPPSGTLLEDQDVLVIQNTDTGHSGPGLYAHYEDMPEEGAIYLDGQLPDSPKGGSEARDSVLTELVQAISAFKGKRGAFMALGAQDERTVRLWWALANAQASDAEVRPNKPPKNWCPTCDKRPNDPAAVLCPDAFHRQANSHGAGVSDD